MYLRTLGGLRLDGSTFARPKPLLLVTYLALEGPKARADVAELFWLRRKPRHNLAMALSLLRKGAPGLVAGDGHKVWATVDVDALQLLTMLADGHLERAVALYEGPFLEGVHGADWGTELEEWVYATRERVAERVRDALLTLAERDVQAQRSDAAARRAETAFGLVGAPELDAPTLRRVYALLPSNGGSLAREAQRVADDLGIDLAPSAANVRAHAHSADAPPRPASLPEARFVGREALVQHLGQLLHDPACRLITLTGPGGVGKTQLALHVASQRFDQGRFAGRTFVVLLGGIGDAALMMPAIAKALGVRERAEQPLLDGVQERLVGGDALVVLDNFEQVIDAADVVRALLHACPRLTVMITSRTALRLTAEQLFPVAPLSVPAAGEPLSVDDLLETPAVALFVERARAVKPDFALTDANKEAVAELCIRLDGLPLALELAAARVRLFSPNVMLRQFTDRFELLRGGARDAPARHQTMERATAWSYDLLSEEERALFRRLSVFVGGFAIEAAERVGRAAGETGGDLAEGVVALVDKSLLQAHGDGRCTMLETLREFGERRLAERGEDAATRQAHAEYYLALAEAAGAELTGPQQGSWFARLDRDRENLRVALDWSESQGQAELGVRLAGALWRYWLARGHMREGRERLERLVGVVAHPGDVQPSDLHASDSHRNDSQPSDLPTSHVPPSDALANALHGLGTILYEMGEIERARAVLERSLTLWRELGNERGLVAVLNNLGWMSCVVSDLAGARQRSQEALTLARARDEQRGVAVALNNLGWAAMYAGDVQEAERCFRDGVAVRRALGDVRGVAFALANLAWAERRRGDLAGAGTHLDEAVATVAPLGDDQILGWALAQQGQLVFAEGEHATATELLERSVTLLRKVGSDPGLVFALVALAETLCEQGRPQWASAALAEALELCQKMRDHWTWAWGLGVQGCVALADGDTETAFACYRESMRMRVDYGDRYGVAECADALGRLHASVGDAERAVHMLVTADRVCDAIGAVQPAWQRARRAQVLADLRASLGEPAFANASAGARERPLDVVLAAVPR